MYILLALIAACSLGIWVHYLIPHRDLRGVAVAPAIATVSTGGIYTGMQWAGVGQDSVWIWVASILGGLAIAAIVTAAITTSRRRTDADARTALGI